MRRWAATRGAQAGARERLPVGRGEDACTRRFRHRDAEVGARERLPGNERRARAAWGGHLEVLKWARATVARDRADGANAAKAATLEV